MIVSMAGRTIILQMLHLRYYVTSGTHGATCFDDKRFPCSLDTNKKNNPTKTIRPLDDAQKHMSRLPEGVGFERKRLNFVMSQAEM